jgi:O-antigen/teichoic acid export membrane protein
MRIQDHLSKLSWTFADKALYVGYGFVQLLQIKALSPEELACYALVTGLYTFAVTLSDASLLQSVIMFGHDTTQRRAVARFALGSHSAWIAVFGLVLVLLQVPLARVLHEPRLGSVMWYVPILSVAALPRMLVLKLLYRDVQARAIFAVNAAWFGSMTLVTAWMLLRGLLHSFADMLLIAIVGLLCSSLGAVWVARKQLATELLRTREQENKEQGTREQGATQQGTGEQGVKQQRAGQRRLAMVVLPATLREFVAYQGAISLAGNAVKQLDIYLVQYFFGMVTVGVYQSAKTLFRFVDEAFSALIGLLYPGAVRLINQQRVADLRAFLSKALSFTFVGMLGLVAVTVLGGAQLVFTLLLPAKYQAASVYFIGLSLAAPCIAFSMLAVVIIAFGESRVLLRYMLIAGSLGLAAVVAVGMAGVAFAVPVGFVVYHLVLGGFTLHYIRRKMTFPYKLIFRSLPDTKNFLLPFIEKQKNATK